MTPSGPSKFNAGCFKRQGSAVWEFFYATETGRRTSMKGFSSLSETQKLRQKIRDQVRLKRLGFHDATEEAFNAGQSAPIDDLVKEYEATKRNPKVTSKHADKVFKNIRDCVSVGGFKRASAITRDAVEVAVEAIRVEREWSHESCNQMMTAVLGFVRWLERKGAIRGNPLAGVTRYNVKVDRHHDRRELTDKEITELLGAAIISKNHRNGGPLDRYVLCRTALETGFRKSELAALDKTRFVLSGNAVGVTLEAGEDKAKRGAIQPIGSQLAAILADYLRDKTDRPNILRVPFKTDQMMRRLCKRGKVVHCKGGKYADFHAWRHTFISRLANSSDPVIPLPVVQKLARHANIETTMKYVHRRPDDERRAVEAHGGHCAALALALDGGVRDMLVLIRTGAAQADNTGSKAIGGGKTTESSVILDGEEKCTGGELNPKPSASEAKGQSHSKNRTRKTYVKPKPTRAARALAPRSGTSRKGKRMGNDSMRRKS